ncbi:methyltransferase domain-containing protein [Pikeienuella piscinae]|uniref:Methyltransferase domain-containing protein n=1 Tax=Pikeienuella piscinae TaxID=2748098 RepID=A0A7L5BV29_9RHOB|nr:class I SAM-dependent methyltransferase [Pikeienuella piscinae]QIE56180.1 methyltransferase domain-containing protein [Pikeienuella piscinae]
MICNQLWPDRESARAAPVGDIDLVRCETCAFIWNRAFEPERVVYATGYENALHHSTTFQAFAKDLSRHLIDSYDLVGKHVIEIGCGDGHMLDLLMQGGVATATGFDPSMEGRESPFAARPGVEIVPEYFDSRQLRRPFDMITCRHVLEHLDTPRSLLETIRDAIGDRDVPVYFEVPNAEWMLESVSIWDVIYEHVGYWSAASIASAFRRAGFKPVSVRSGYAGQFLMVEMRPDGADTPDSVAGSDRIAALADNFRDATIREIADWRARLAGASGKVVIWGAGSKGVTFANALGPDGGALAAMVDLNERKHGLFAPGVALEIVPPEALIELSPDLVLISNALYRAEISEQVRGMGLSPDFAVLAG